MVQSLPNIKVLVRDSFLYDGEDVPLKSHGILVFARAIKAKALTFGVLLDNGVLFTGLPIHALCSQEDAKPINLEQAQMWDCLSYSFNVIEVSLLRYMNCTVKLTDDRILKGEYLFSIDWDSKDELSGVAEMPDEWKMMHFIRLDDGQFVLYPQNRILFKDNSLTDNVEVPRYKVNTQDWKCEDWKSKLDDGYRY